MRSRIPIRARSFILPILLLSTIALSAQEEHGLAIVAGGGSGIGTAIADFSALKGYELFSRGRIESAHVSAGLVIPLGDSRRHALIARGAYAHSTLHYTHDFPGALILLPGEPDPVASTDHQDLAYTMTDIGLELLFHYNPYKGVGVAAGVGIGGRSVESWEMTHYSAYPPFRHPFDTTPMRDNGHIRVLDDGSNRDFNPVSFALLGSATYAVRIDDRLGLIPALGARLDLVSPHRGTTVQTVSFVAELSLRYDL
jgi:hypothetical protein